MLIISCVDFQKDHMQDFHKLTASAQTYMAQAFWRSLTSRFTCSSEYGHLIWFLNSCLKAKNAQTECFWLKTE